MSPRRMRFVTARELDAIDTIVTVLRRAGLTIDEDPPELCQAYAAYIHAASEVDHG